MRVISVIEDPGAHRSKAKALPDLRSRSFTTITPATQPSRERSPPRACDYVMPDAARIGGVSVWIQATGIAAADGIEMPSLLLPEIRAYSARRA